MGSLLQPRSLYAVVTLQQHVFVIGGVAFNLNGSSAFYTMEFLAANSLTWQQGPPLPFDFSSYPVMFDTEDSPLGGPLGGGNFAQCCAIFFPPKGRP